MAKKEKGDFKSERGESQYFFLALALLASCGVSAICFLQGCIYEIKEERVERRRNAWLEAHKQTPKIDRKVRGTVVSY